ncbi:hypothetical protein ACFVH6_36080 [Spirillospora sp. NPDC127200]
MKLRRLAACAIFIPSLASCSAGEGEAGGGLYKNIADACSLVGKAEVDRLLGDTPAPVRERVPEVIPGDMQSVCSWASRSGDGRTIRIAARLYAEKNGARESAVKGFSRSKAEACGATGTLCRPFSGAGDEGYLRLKYPSDLDTLFRVRDENIVLAVTFSRSASSSTDEDIGPQEVSTMNNVISRLQKIR